MPLAALTGSEPASRELKSSRFRPLARSLRVGPTKRTQGEVQKEGKRAAVVLRPGMRQSEFRRIEVRMNRNNLARLPIIVGATARPATVPDGPLCGLIVTGSDGIAHPDERAGLEAIVRDARSRDVPVLAFSDAAPLALAAIGREPPRTAHEAVIIAEEVRALSARADIDRAIDMMASLAVA